MGSGSGALDAWLPPGRRERVARRPVMPLTFVMGVPSKFPTQTATVTARVKPAAQLSRKPFEVPVFAATSKGKSSTERSPNAPRGRVVILEDVGDEGGELLRQERAAASPGRTRSEAPARRDDARHEAQRLVEPTAAGQGRVRARQLEERDLAVPERETRPVVVRGLGQRRESELVKAIEELARAEPRRPSTRRGR